MSIKLIVAVKGSAKSGNYNHAGIPGHQGGSRPKSSLPAPSSAMTLTDKTIYKINVSKDEAKSWAIGDTLQQDGHVANGADYMTQQKNPDGTVALTFQLPKSRQATTPKPTTPATNSSSASKSDIDVQDFNAVDKLINSPDVLAKLKVPDKMYHVTSRSNLESIQKNGLSVKHDRSSSEGIIKGAYMTDDPSDVLKAQGDIKIKDPVVLEISTNGLKLRLDPEYYQGNGNKKGAMEYIDSVNKGDAQFALYSKAGVPASNITVMKGHVQGNNWVGD